MPDLLHPYQTQHLILLIGENPLPNFVAARLLLQSGGTAHLAHTTGTQRQANQLKMVLEEDEIHCQDLPLGDSESNASVIQDKIKQRINNLPGSIGLHYTGGTKAMAVHAYQTIREHDSNAVFSYLDSRRLELCIDQVSSDPKRFRITPDMLQTKILSLMGLHGLEQQSSPTDKPVCLDAALAFLHFHQNESAANEWRKWCDFHFKGNGGWKKNTVLKAIDIAGDDFFKSPEGGNLENDGKSIDSFDISNYTEIIAALRCLGVENKFCIKDIKEYGKFQKPDHVWKWLDGCWIEHYVLSQVQKISEQQKISDSANSFFIRDPIKSNISKFEVDVIFTRGYQLFAISCTTSDDRGLCKSKLFEAYVRAQQLGGAEARVALVCCANSDDVNLLKTQIINVFKPIGIEPEDYRVEVFGRDDLLNLSDKISEWIQNVDRDTK
jgi:hypothetical protein